MSDFVWDDPRLKAALTHERAARFLATRDQSGQPYLVPALSAALTDDGDIRFAAVLPTVVDRNLRHHPECGFLVIDQRLQWWSIGATLSRFDEGAPGEKIRRWGVARPSHVWSAGKVSSWRLTVEYSLIRMLGIPKGDNYRDVLPPDVAQRLSMLKAVKAIAFLDDEQNPVALPCGSLVPAGPGALVCGTRATPQLAGIPEEAPVAICLLTFVPSAYQIHGWFEGVGGGLLRNSATIRVAGLHPALA